MKLLRYNAPLLFCGLLQISCGSTAQNPEEIENDATRFTDVKAPEFFIVKVSGEKELSFKESSIMASEDSILPDFSSASTLTDLSSMSEQSAIGQQTGFNYGQNGETCYSQNYQSCNPIYQQGNHRVNYAYAGAYNQGNNTYLSYQRQGLSYYHGAGNIRNYYYPGFANYPWGAPIGPGGYPVPGRYPTAPQRPYPGNGSNIQELRQVVSNLSFKGLPQLSQRTKDQAQMGRRLFSDTRFSLNNNISCKSCHLPEKSFTDGRRIAIGAGVGKLNTPMKQFNLMPMKVF